ncbi:MAG: hypothetical protein JWQ25_2943, partial [Daejeonella sp.]|nr:hypothetical protein [Daejeonella sp.]
MKFCTIKNLFTLPLFLFSSALVFGQIGDRIPIDSIIPAEPTGMDYSPWLNDNLSSLVTNVW